jgi:hypothetical protein
MFDYDRDGDQDVFVANNSDRPMLYRNDGGNQNDWLRIDVEGTRSNRDGIGALVRVTPDLAHPDAFLVREIDGGSNYLGQNEPTAHFGLGPSAEKDTVDLVSIRWPSGQWQHFAGVARNSTLTAVEPVPEPAGTMLMLLAVVAMGHELLVANQRNRERANVLRKKADHENFEERG